MEHKLLKPYRTVLKRLTLFIRRYDKHPTIGNKANILDTFEVIKQFDTSIRLNALNDPVLANNLVFATITLFDQCISAFLSQRDFTKEIEDVRKNLHFQDPNKEQVYRPAIIEKPAQQNEPKYYDYTWFKVGVLFAQGKPQKLYEKYKSDKGHFTIITKELGFKNTDKNYFSETLNKLTKGDKDIYSNLDQMLKIEKYCNDNKIDITNSFTDQIKLLQKRY